MDAQQRKRLLDLQADWDDDDGVDELFPLMLEAVMASEGEPAKKHGGSRPGKRPNLPRDHAEGHTRIMRDYFEDEPVFPPKTFRRRFRMSRRLFQRIHDAIVAHDSYFVQRPDATGKLGLSSIQKITAALRMFCYSCAADAVDEYVRIAESTAMKCFIRFADAVIDCFGDEYLRQPTPEDIAKQTAVNAARGFPGMFGSLDCTHWVWKNCAVGLKGQYRDKDGKSSMILEAVSSYNLWIWHAYVGLPGSNNDIDIIDRSSFVMNWLHGNAPSHKFTLNGKPYKSCYLLCDGIYPNWSIFVKTISRPQSEKERYFANRQEAKRKDVERCFGVLKGRFSVLSQPSRLWDEAKLRRVWTAAIIMHNMIVEDEEDDEDQEEYFERPVVNAGRFTAMPFEEFLARMLANTVHCATTSLSTCGSERSIRNAMDSLVRLRHD